MQGHPETASDRHRLILERLEDAGRVEVCDLAASFDVAQETVRRDLKTLETQGLLQRVHGGAVRREERPLSPFEGMTPEVLPRHALLAEAVVDRLPADGTVFVDPSPLTAAVAETLSRRPSAELGITVVTTSLDVAVVLSRVEAMSVYNVGGRVEPQARSQQGSWAIEELRRFSVDLAVLSPSGLTSDGRVLAATSMDAAMLEAELAAAHRVWLLLDVGDDGRLPGDQTAGIQSGRLEAVSAVFLAGTPDPRDLDLLAGFGVEVICVP